MSKAGDKLSEHVLILAPRGRDALVVRDMLEEARIDGAVCASLPDLVRALNDGVGLALITDEALRDADLKGLSGWLASQPAWSDLPIVLLTERGGGVERNPFAARIVGSLGNVTFLERPFHPTTLISVVNTALRGRRRQYEAREHIAERERSAVNLENLVRDRTRRLIETNRQLRYEMVERKQAEAALRQAQKMETIGQLTGGVAHDFNNLLMAVIGNLDLLKRRIGDDARLHRLVDGAMQGAQRGAALTQRLLAFARKQDLKAEAVDIGRLIGEMLGLLERSLGPQIKVDLRIPTAMPAAQVDPNQLELAILNLAVNARDAMPHGGTITISLDKALADAKSGEEIVPGTYLRLCVRDTGTGMDEQTLARAIEPFFSTKELGKGTGLGLSMVHGLAVQSGGILRLRSRPGEGALAELLLPLAETAAVTAQPVADVASEAAPSTILVVDDDALIAMSTVDMLEDLGHHVLEASSGAKALDILRGGVHVDLLLTDFAMPGMTGVELAQAARALRPALPILLATGYAELPDGAQFTLPRLSKPYQQQQLAASLGRLLGSAKDGGLGA